MALNARFCKDLEVCFRIEMQCETSIQFMNVYVIMHIFPCREGFQ